MEIKKSNCVFSTDESGKMVVCKFKGANNIFKDFALKNVPEFFNEDDYNNDEYTMSESFSCRAPLGRDKQAFWGMRFKLQKQFRKRMNKFFENKGLNYKEQNRIFELSMIYLK